MLSNYFPYNNFPPPNNSSTIVGVLGPILEVLSTKRVVTSPKIITKTGTQHDLMKVKITPTNIKNRSHRDAKRNWKYIQKWLKNDSDGKNVVQFVYQRQETQCGRVFVFNTTFRSFAHI